MAHQLKDFNFAVPKSSASEFLVHENGFAVDGPAFMQILNGILQKENVRGLFGLQTRVNHKRNDSQEQCHIGKTHWGRHRMRFC
jgi:hypothetical protein